MSYLRHALKDEKESASLSSFVFKIEVEIHTGHAQILSIEVSEFSGMYVPV